MAPVAMAGSARDDVLMSAEQFSQRLEVQAAAIARRQSAGVGIHPETMRTRVRSGRWQRLQWGVYAAFSGDPARETVLWAALLRAGPGAVLSHQTAAERHGLTDEPSQVITITVPASRSPARDRIRLAMGARKKMRWRREVAVALGYADEGALSLLEYWYVHRSCQTAASVATVLRLRGWTDTPHPCSRPVCCIPTP
jgi:hypothetical protein